MPTLNDLGLSDYEARVYRALLSAGSATAKELSLTSDVPMGRVYDVLGSLEKNSLVRSQAASRPKKYVAVEPETALDRLVDEKKRELREEMERYEKVADELTGKLDTAETVEERFWTAAVGADDSIELLLERLEAARDSVSMVVGDLSPQIDPDDVGEQVLDRLADSVDDGVSVHILVSSDLVSRFGQEVGARYTDVLSEYPGFEIRTVEEIRGTFNVVDGVEVCVEVANPLAPNRVLAMIDLKDPEFAASVGEEFDERWDGAKPLEL
ncbi:TrmB family transcriptional regulator [Haladaptatus sp. F3-133]|jgi:sugar-specific transcriptional regulator TrmB|uniref:TrmB family transcriptional regulator n=1 Tax=Halorutilus salinus TaxID=2487751 RepID=A0A9Q4C2D5_9EURY|nr:helix-turn-helix domain-containing protein [Halorutilus salinus]MCX2817817.1 TrmB family transcriptional regulator [Halorutilus salinus]